MAYAYQDALLAAELARRLADAGFEVWNPGEEIVPGENWASKIGQALDASDILLAVLTPGAMQSEELRRTIQYGLTAQRFERRFLPVLSGFVTLQAGKDVPWILLKMNPVFLTPESGLDAVVEAIRTVMKHETNAAR